jgi:hypothetical protein
LTHLHRFLGQKGYAYSSSTLPAWAFRRGPVFDDFGLPEFPLSGSGDRPLTLLDSWSWFAAPDRRETEADYVRRIEAAARRASERGVGPVEFLRGSRARGGETRVYRRRENLFGERRQHHPTTIFSRGGPVGADAVGIYKNPWGPNPPRPKVEKTLRAYYRYAVWFKANPRGEDTLRALFDARFPGGRWVNADVDPAAARAALGEERLVLVYPGRHRAGAGGSGARRVARPPRSTARGRLERARPPVPVDAGNAVGPRGPAFVGADPNPGTRGPGPFPSRHAGVVGLGRGAGANMIDDVRGWWKKNPMSYGESHGVPVYGNQTYEFGTREFFERLDETFYSWNRPLHGARPFDRLFPYEKYKGQRVLEIGCGMGTMIMNWARAGARVTAVDLNPFSIEQTRRRFALFGLEGAIEPMDARSLAFPDGAFDYVYSWGCCTTPRRGSVGERNDAGPSAGRRVRVDALQPPVVVEPLPGALHRRVYCTGRAVSSRRWNCRAVTATPPGKKETPHTCP